MVESFANGDLVTAGKDLMTLIAFESPNLAIQMALGRISPALAMTYMGVTSAGRERAGLEDSASLLRKVLEPYVAAAIEVSSEKIGTGRIIDRISKNEVIEGAMKRLTTIALDFLGGAASEGGATLGGNLLDKAFGDDVGAFDGLLESMLLGGVMDSSVGAMAQVR
jgi:hypothetical protein